MRVPSVPRPLLPVVAAMFSLLVAGCGSSPEQLSSDRDQMQTLLEEYLPLLGRAYGEQNAELIAPWVAPKEVARVETRIRELYAQGSILEPVLHRVTVEDIQVWNNSNAFVTTVETWDVKRYASGAMELIGEEIGQTHRVRYQMKRDGGRWKVLYRTIED